MRSILIYDKDINYSGFKYNGKIYLLYDAKVINPPFFDKIIVTKKDLNEEDIKMIYNMLNLNGKLYYIPDYNKYLSTLNPIIENKFNVVTKKNNFQYQIKYNRVVDFIIAGTQKGGTTALALNISHHPDIYIDNNPDPMKSEIHFFDIYWKKGIEFYKSKIDYSKKMVGEKTPDLMYLSYTFPLIQSVNPYVKIILILRNPIERAYSAWKLVTKYFGEKRTFEEAITEDKSKENITFFTSQTHYLERGLYYKQLMELYKWFPKHNVLVLISEKVKDNMKDEYNKVYEFLNLEPYDYDYKLEFESSDKSKLDDKIYNKLVKYYKKDVSDLEKLLNIKTSWLK
jgi:hypothetical protein